MKIADYLSRFPPSKILLVDKGFEISYKKLQETVEALNLEAVPNGSTVALIGDFDLNSISLMIKLIEKKCIFVPLTKNTVKFHQFYIENGFIEYLISNDKIEVVRKFKKEHPLIRELKEKGSPGLIVFSSGTTGFPKAILHDLDVLLQKFKSSNKKLKMIAFLLFDHMGGFNTFFSALFSGSQLINPGKLDPETIFSVIENSKVELLPTTPSFLRQAIYSIDFSKYDLSSLKLITYGAELMDLKTLEIVNELLPNVDCRQTYGLSELGVFPVKTKSKSELWIKIGSEDVQTKIKKDTLHIKAKYRMKGYLNAESPFDNEGFYNTKDLVKQEEGWIIIKGRETDIINIGGLKISPSEVEEKIQRLPYVKEVQVFGRNNPITGQHVEARMVTHRKGSIDKYKIKKDMISILSEEQIPAKIHLVDKIEISHRYKRAGV